MGILGSVGSVVEGGNRLDVSDDFTQSPLKSWSTFNLDSTGRSWVSKTGWTTLGLMGSYDLDGLPSQTESRNIDIWIYSAETSNKPKLIVTYGWS
jgi:hypothetical protein